MCISCPRSPLNKGVKAEFWAPIYEVLSVNLRSRLIPTKEKDMSVMDVLSFFIILTDSLYFLGKKLYLCKTD